MARRAQAPAGGCTVFGEFYEGGQFLPYHRVAQDRQHTLSPAQIQAAAAYASRIDRDRAASSHVGQVGERIKARVTIGTVLTFDGFYGPTYLTIARDEVGNVYVSKGTRWANQGDVVSIVATVKELGERDGVRQTVLQRVKVQG